ncbi:MAG: hypothetical protein QXP52_00130 [Candidatus Aenigmatarchaeota archaeon]
MGASELRIIVPSTIFQKLEKIEKEQGIRKEDLIMRALVKVLEEFGA